jgi:hypothetical protein
MNIILGVLSATMFIAGLILIRMFADHYVLRARIRGGHTNKECEPVGCFRGCARDDEAVPENDSVARQNRNTKRSVNHAH